MGTLIDPLKGTLIDPLKGTRKTVGFRIPRSGGSTQGLGFRVVFEQCGFLGSALPT